ncbi:sulfotransferase [Mesorhizobium sp.]|uniref:sulfotransferase family protein n=1 Tax=Mesorhizobium sp. TaxID=1871066 RepID=UPI0025BBCFAC|nr:sulfotransferase [Mesorhizobium sp.]
MVLGMHRSGTSALTRAISLLGAELPKNTLGANPTNPAGHWEPSPLIELHEQMLADAGSRWDDWRSFDQTDLGVTRLRFYKAEIAKLIDQEYGSAPLFVLKEPRISRFVPLYAEILKRMNVEVRYVLTQRNPLAVIASLEKRDGFTFGFSALLWLRHALEAERATRGKSRVFVSYEAMLDDWRTGVDKIAEALQVKWPQPSVEAISTHFSTDHQHHTATADLLYADPRITHWVKQAYSALKDLERDPSDAAAMARLDAVRMFFDSVTPVFGPAFFLEVDSRVRKLAQAGSQALRLADERAAEIDRQAADLAKLRQEIESKEEHPTQQHETLQRLASERAAAIDKLQLEASAKEAELAEKRDALHRLIGESTAREAALIAEIEHERRDVARLLEQSEILRAEIQKIKDSSSWKITYPMRYAKSLFKREPG